MLEQEFKLYPQCINESTKSFVLDAEAVAIDRATGKLMPFQELSRRKRKDVKVEDIQVRVCLFAFDLLYLNGEVRPGFGLSCWQHLIVQQPLLQLPLQKRRELLREHFTAVAGEFEFAKSSDGETTEEIQGFLEESVKDGCEGLMVKMLDTDASFYEPSRRSVNWLKVGLPLPRLNTNLGLTIFLVEKGLSCWCWGLPGSCRCRRILREGKEDECLWCIPACMLRRRLGRVPDYL